MTDAPRRRPAKHSVLHSFSAPIKAAPRAVFEALDARLSPDAPAGFAYLSDPQGFLIIVQGGWWYRAEYRVIPDDRGTIIEHVVLNVAQVGDRLALAAGRRAIQTAPLAFHELVKALRAELE